MQDWDFLKEAIENSKTSSQKGFFPAGAVVGKNGKIISSEISSPAPNLLHPDSKAMIAAFEKQGPLSGATLYAGLEPCLMCTGMAYWSGIRRIVYAVPKSKVSGDYYETHEHTAVLPQKFNEKIDFVHSADMEQEALSVIQSWEQGQT